MLNIHWVFPGSVLTSGYSKLAFCHLLPFKNICPLSCSFLVTYLAKVNSLIILLGKGCIITTPGMCKLHLWNISFIQTHMLIVDFQHYLHGNSGWHTFFKKFSKPVQNKSRYSTYIIYIPHQFPYYNCY